MRLFCFGFGYTAARLAEALPEPDLSVAGTRRSAEARSGIELARFRGDAPSQEVEALLPGTTHLLISIPPDLEGDPTLRHHAAAIAALPQLAWIGYLSSVGVYGDWQGAWVDEASPTRPSSERALRRLRAEEAWLDFASRTGRRVQIFRLAGIYGPGRSVLEQLRAGKGRRIVKQGQVFNRIHVEDIARVLAAAIAGATQDTVFNVGDDEPAPPQEVVAFAAALLGLPAPPEVPFEEALLQGMAASFWAENRRVANTRIKHALGVKLAYPTYREGLTALAKGAP
jgi:nucleoside-diphosphate-sugar epimerase